MDSITTLTQDNFEKALQLALGSWITPLDGLPLEPSTHNLEELYHLDRLRERAGEGYLNWLVGTLAEITAALERGDANSVLKNIEAGFVAGFKVGWYSHAVQSGGALNRLSTPALPRRRGADPAKPRGRFVMAVHDP